MRDAFGGTFMLEIFLVFILIYICFTAMSINYAKAFKVKNALVEYLETSEITDLSSLNASQIQKLENFIDKEILGTMNYNQSNLKICDGISGVSDSTTGGIVVKDAVTGKDLAYCHASGIIIEQAGVGENTEGVYYTVSTYIGWGMPFLNKLLAISGSNRSAEVPIGAWKISGETRLIVNE